MPWTDAQKARIAAKLNAHDLYFLPAEVPLTVNVPEAWRHFGPIDADRTCIPLAWRHFTQRLPWVGEWVHDCVLGTLLAVGDRPYLVYVYDSNDDLYLYLGGAPLGPDSQAFEKHPEIPGHVIEFYTRLHDGFGFYIGGDMGPSPVEAFVSIKDMCDDDYPGLPDMTAIFSSGAGDYLAVGQGAWKGEAFIWWHEEPDTPTCDIDLWVYMDAWMSIFLEDSTLNAFAQR